MDDLLGSFKNLTVSPRQKHGFDYELLIIEKYKMIKEISYTGKYDAYHNKIPVQIKCIKNKTSIELGDFVRNQTKTEDFIMMVGFWETEKTNIVNTHIIYVDHVKYKSIFAFDKTKEMTTELKTISNNIKDDQKWKEYRLKYKNLYKSDVSSLRFKRDHKTQKRIQVAISFKNFNDKFVKLFKNYKMK